MSPEDCRFFLFKVLKQSLQSFLFSLEKYLYADATTAPHAGYPLKYATRPLIPKMKCLSFWYYMYGSGIGMLSVNIRQGNDVYKEIFRLYGDQGPEWRSASVPLTGLNERAEQFQVNGSRLMT